MNVKRYQKFTLLFALTLIVAVPDALLSKEKPNTEATGNSESREESAPGEGGPLEKNPPIFYLRDGGKVTGKPAFDELEIRTRYGVLRVPARDLIQVRLAQRVDSDVEERVEELIEKMGDEDFDVREQAMEEIQRIGSDAVPLLRRAATSDNGISTELVEVLVEELQSEEPKNQVVESEMKPIENHQDEVVTRRFTILGHVTQRSFSVESRYGILDLSCGDLVGVLFQHGGKISRLVDVTGNHAAPKSWLKTELNLVKGQSLSIQAKGQLHVPNYNFSAGPGGTRHYSSSSNFRNFPTLALVGKIGSGKGFFIGNNYKRKAPSSGVLYVGIVPFRRHTATGSYKLRIVAGN